MSYHKIRSRSRSCRCRRLRRLSSFRSLKAYKIHLHVAHEVLCIDEDGNDCRRQPKALHARSFHTSLCFTHRKNESFFTIVILCCFRYTTKFVVVCVFFEFLFRFLNTKFNQKQKYQQQQQKFSGSFRKILYFLEQKKNRKRKQNRKKNFISVSDRVGDGMKKECHRTNDDEQLISTIRY